MRRYVGGRVSLDVQYDLRNAIYERLQRLDFASHDQLQTGQLVCRASLRRRPDPGAAVVPADHARQRRAARRRRSWSWSFLSPPLTLVALAVAPLLLVRVAAAADARCSRPPGTPSSGPARWPASSTRRSPACGSSRASARRTASSTSLADAAGDLFASRARAGPPPGPLPADAAGDPGRWPRSPCSALGGWLAIEGHITLGTFLAFSTYLVQLVAPVRMLAGLLAVGQQARAGAERVLDLLDATARVRRPSPTPRSSIGRSPGPRSRFDDVALRLHAVGEPVLDAST